MRRMWAWVAAAMSAVLALRLAFAARALQAAQETRDALRAEIAQRRVMTDEEVRSWARQRGLIAPGDTVFFDGGAWDEEAEASK